MISPCFNVHVLGITPSLGLETPVSAWKRTMELNVNAVIHGTWLALEEARKSGRKVTVISTASGAGSLPTGLTVYSASKHAVSVSELRQLLVGLWPMT